eukprot:g50249.t1
MAGKKLDMWLDKKADRLNLPGMLEGIAELACFVLWGTGGYFDRKFCLWELEMARLLKKTIVCIRESDDRMYPLSFQDLCRADPQLVLHDVVAVNREYWNAFADKIAHRLQAEAKKAEEEAKKVGGATDVLQWDVAAVTKWLAGLDLGQDVVESFQKNKINGSMLLKLENEDLQEDIGITSRLVRKNILANIEALQKK